MKKSLVTNSADTEHMLGYFRPGFYPIKTRQVLPALVWLSEAAYCNEPDVELIFVKSACLLHEWQDAMLVSEHDFDNAMAGCINIADNGQKIHQLITQLTQKGYQPLHKIKAELQVKELH